MAAQELDIEVRLILEAIYERYHYDFRDYAGTSLRRRLKAAMQRFECANLSQLQGRLLREPDVFRSVLGDLTVQVSEMFRDPEYYLALREHAHQVCFPDTPACNTCVIRKACNHRPKVH